MRDLAISADGLLIHYDVQGQGLPALVFVHGWACNHRYWQKQMDYFAAHYTVVAIDLGGHGDSGLNRATWTIAAFGEDVVAVVEKLRLAQVVLIGHSMGGTVIVEAARLMPERVIGVVEVDNFKNLGQLSTQADADAFLAPFRSDFALTTNSAVRAGMFLPSSDAALVETIAKEMAATPPHVGIGAGEEVFRYDEEREAVLHAMQVPIVLINSDYTPTDQEAAERYGIRVELMSGVGHFVMLEDPETFNRILGEVVRRIVAEAVD